MKLYVTAAIFRHEFRHLPLTKCVFPGILFLLKICQGIAFRLEMCDNKERWLWGSQQVKNLKTAAGFGLPHGEEGVCNETKDV